MRHFTGLLRGNVVPPSPQDNRPPMVVAMRWVSQISSVSFEMAIPAGVGWWLDQEWDTEPWLLISGAVLGFYAGFTHLLQIVKAANAQQTNSSRSSKQ
ncbi:MAG: hypothetical protein CMJ78_26380 [Planctomycetaceae bacterium]|nr:hypothetical protein [Planctomycetaceae bacterium]